MSFRYQSPVSASGETIGAVHRALGAVYREASRSARKWVSEGMTHPRATDCGKALLSAIP
ncbi:hypothetical protein GOE00_08985 [Sinorhizobium medicae]|nr:hypothetical protein [Sinorhizobium medicae]MDX0866878.1 hypothetical protein [Sinorhizobium medicae]MDX0891408.1 hypothetical protein [Sinorhizobium medicae]PLU45100.1 hypothetical protein BMJ28_02370 [Sinorhizobium medicae]